MRHPLNYCAAAQGIATPQEPTTHQAPSGDAHQATKHRKRSGNLDARGTSHIGQALEVIEGEAYARAFLQRLRAGTSAAGELAVILDFLQGDMLRGACRVIEKELGVQHG